MRQGLFLIKQVVNMFCKFILTSKPAYEIPPHNILRFSLYHILCEE